MRESNKKQLNILFSVLICVFGAVGIATVSLLGGGFEGALSSAIVISDDSEGGSASDGLTSSAIDVSDGSEGGSVSGTSAILVLPDVVLTYGEVIPETASATVDGNSVTVNIDWSGALDKRPGVGVQKDQSVTVTYNSNTWSGYTAHLIVNPAELNSPASFGENQEAGVLELTYGTPLPTSIYGWTIKNEEIAGNGVLKEDSKFKVWCNVTWDWDATRIVSVEDMQNGYRNISYTASVSAAMGISNNYVKNQTGTIRVKVNPLVLDNPVGDTGISSTLEHIYSTDVATIAKEIQTLLRANLTGKENVSAIVLNKIVGNLKFYIEKDEVVLTTIWDAKESAYALTVKVDSSSVRFKKGEGDTDFIPNVNPKVKINQMTLGTAQIKTVLHPVYDGTPKPVKDETIIFASNKGIADKEKTLTVTNLIVEYLQNNKPLGSGVVPTQVGLYQVKIFVNDTNYITPKEGMQVDYYITKNPDASTFLTDVKYDGKTYANIFVDEGNIGRIEVPFSFDGYTPKIDLPTIGFEIHRFNTVTYTVVDRGTGNGVAQILNAGQYDVTFKFTSPNFDDYTLTVIYEVTPVSVNDDKAGFDVIKNQLFTKDEQTNQRLILEYSGEEYTTFNFMTKNQDWLKKYNIDINVILADSGVPIKNIGAYVATFQIQSLNHDVEVPQQFTIEVVKKEVVIPTTQISLKFDATPKKPIPNVTTGLNGVYASAYIASIFYNGQELENAKDGVINAGTYTFRYKLNPHEFVYTVSEYTDVTVIVAKATKTTLENLIKQVVVFNNRMRIDTKEYETFAPKADGLENLTKYGVSLVRDLGELELETGTGDSLYYFDGLTFETEAGGYRYVTFVFSTDNYDVLNGKFEYQIRYDMPEDSDALIVIFSVIGGLVAIVVAAYVLSFVGKRKALAAGVRPSDRAPTIYDKPTYKPDSPGPRPVKEKPVKEPKAPKAPKPPKPVVAPKAVGAPKPAPQKSEPKAKNSLDLMSNMKMGNSREIGKFSDTKVFKDKK
jgi:hypothetical protein